MASDSIWLAVVELCGELGPVELRRSRWACKPALQLGGREIAHLEVPGRVDLRLTAKGWRAVASSYVDDPRVTRDPAQWDWIELTLAHRRDVDSLKPLFQQAIAANGG
ncbi:MAG TPA: luciferase family protein [Jatrophihabitantaceae bacterium]|jgi:hypothetical protein